MLAVITQKMSDLYIKNKSGQRIVKKLDSMTGEYW